MIKRVLLIDDEEVDNFISEKVIKNANFSDSIVITTSARGALRYLETHPNQLPELILLDVKMPAMNGFEFLQNFRKFPASIIDTCNIIALSSLVEETEIKNIKELPHISGFFSKPLNESKLEEIRSILARKTNLSQV